MAVGREFVADLKAVRDALSHVIPDGSLEKVLHECLRRTRRELERRREGATIRPPTHEPPTAEVSTTRHIPRAVRREVFARDAGRCTYVGPTGVVCGSTYQLELHHIHPYAMGGPSTAANVALRCAVHNHHTRSRTTGGSTRARDRGRARNAAQHDVIPGGTNRRITPTSTPPDQQPLHPGEVLRSWLPR